MNSQIGKWFQEATRYHQKGDFSLAAKLYRQILRQFPKHSDSLHLLGLINAEQGNLNEALTLINKAVSYNPKFLPYYINRSLVYRRLSKWDEAIADYRYILNQNPNAYDTYTNLGDALLEQEKIDEAIQNYQRSIEINPHYLNGQHNLGNAYLAKKSYNAAISCYQKALALKADSVETLSNLGVALAALENHTEAIDYYQHALKIDPKYVQAYSNLGLALAALDNFDEAKVAYEKAIAIKPEFADSYSHLGILHKDHGDVEKAIQYFKKSLELKPEHPEFQFNLAISQLLLGNFAEGLDNYESRLKLKERQNVDYKFSQPLWQGEDLNDKKLFIWVEQGLGDTIQYLRFLRYFNKYSNLQIFLEYQPELYSLLQSNINDLYPSIILVPRRPPQFNFDYHIAIMSLSRIFKIKVDTIPDADAYLKSSPSHYLQNLLSSNLSTDSFKIGLNWCGSKLHKNDKNRSLRLSQLALLVAMAKDNPKFSLYSIQYGATSEEIEPFKNELKDLSSHIKDLSDTAALIQQLDLVITVDTAIAHLAGALGKETCVLLPYAPDFRWLLNREDSPWYKSIRLWRQSKSHDWQSVINQICKNF